jgi:hypothetical protein
MIYFVKANISCQSEKPREYEDVKPVDVDGMDGSCVE